VTDRVLDAKSKEAHSVYGLCALTHKEGER
jgi:hypothetical protein